MVCGRRGQAHRTLTVLTRWNGTAWLRSADIGREVWVRDILLSPQGDEQIDARLDDRHY
jgi:hypothetical protein